MARDGDSRGERRRLAELRLHAEASRVPDMSREEYAAFLADIERRGLLTPLEVTAAGVVLDGRHRLRAAQELGLADLPVRVVAPEDELEHVLLAAFQRRHLTPSQRAALAIELDVYEEARRVGKERRRANLRNLEVATLPLRGERSDTLAGRLGGVSPRTIRDAAIVREADPSLFEAVKAGRIPVHRAAKQVRRERRLVSVPPAPPLPIGPFDVIYADPPWRSQSPGSDWAPESHYETMTPGEIEALTVPAAKDALLFLWAVNALLPEALAVMAAWGYEYRTNLAWVKPSIGLGFWTRNRHELLLVGRRGRFPLPEEPDRPDSVIEAERGRHSAKPFCVYELIERMTPGASRVELFARSERPGWVAWGNEVAA